MEYENVEEISSSVCVCICMCVGVCVGEVTVQARAGLCGWACLTAGCNVARVWVTKSSITGGLRGNDVATKPRARSVAWVQCLTTVISSAYSLSHVTHVISENTFSATFALTGGGVSWLGEGRNVNFLPDVWGTL